MGIQENLEETRSRIDAACIRANRPPESVLLLPASKTQSVETIQELYNLGLRDFGESRVQELLKKKDQLPTDIRWNFIGHLQSNKAKYIADFVYAVHTVDSLPLAEELSRRAGSRKLRILIEVNISGEE